VSIEITNIGHVELIKISNAQHTIVKFVSRLYIRDSLSTGSCQINDALSTGSCQINDALSTGSCQINDALSTGSCQINGFTQYWKLRFTGEVSIEITNIGHVELIKISKITPMRKVLYIDL
jgi:hypothetical protein